VTARIEIGAVAQRQVRVRADPAPEMHFLALTLFAKCENSKKK
jgi:hypothetical protein